jgi:hypothetical protein
VVGFSGALAPRSRPRRLVPVLADATVSMVATAPLWVGVFVHALLGL